MEWELCNGLLVPKGFRDEKEFLKEGLKKAVEQTVEENQHRSGRYFIEFRGAFDRINQNSMRTHINVREDLPVFKSSQIVFYVSNRKGICEWLWSVSPDKKVEFNKEGVAYLQAKGAMPTKAA